MKYTFLFIFTLIAMAACCQEFGTFQADSIYKANKVKVIKWLRGTNKKGGTTMYYDKEGRLSKYVIEMNLGASILTTHYLYDHSGKLVSMIDSTINSKPDKKEIKRLKKMGINPSLLMPAGDLPENEVANYTLEYDDEQLVKRTKFNPDGSLDIVDFFEENGKIQKRDWYRNGVLYRNSTTSYLTEFHKENYSGWELGKNGSKLTWEYRFSYEFDDTGNVLSYTRFDGEEKKETVTYSYNSNGLLTEISGNFSEFFEYEYYE